MPLPPASLIDPCESSLPLKANHCMHRRCITWRDARLLSADTSASSLLTCASFLWTCFPSPSSNYAESSFPSLSLLIFVSGSQWSRYRSTGLTGGLGPGGLLLATLPLILAPMLSYLFTPMVIPVTATIAAGRRRKRSLLLMPAGPDDDVSFSMKQGTTSPAVTVNPRLLPFIPESGSVSDFLPRDSQAATPLAFDSRNTMNLSAARRQEDARQFPMSHPRALVSSLKGIQNVSNNVTSRQVRQRQVHHRKAKLRKLRSPA